MWNLSVKIDFEGSARWLNTSFHGWRVTDVLLIDWAHFLAKSRNFLMLHKMVTPCVALSPCVFQSGQIFGWHFKGSLTFWRSIFKLKKKNGAESPILRYAASLQHSHNTLPFIPFILELFPNLFMAMSIVLKLRMNYVFRCGYHKILWLVCRI